MSFLSKMNKPRPVGVKPATPAPTSNPGTDKPEVKKPAPIAKPAVKKPMPLGANKPAMVKPNPLKKPAPTPVVEEVKEEAVVEPQVEETVTDVIEEAGQEVNLGITPEPVEEVVETKEEIDVTHSPEEAATEEVVEEAQQEVKEVKEDTVEKKDDEYTEEELKAMSPQKRAAITRKKNQENKKRKQALEEHKEELAKDEPRTMLNLPKVDINRIEDYMYPVVLPTVDTWEEEKEEVREVVSTIEIDPDMNSATGKVVLSDLASAYSTMTSRLTHYKTQYENLTGKDGVIECVKAMFGQGKNAEERKFAATEACMNYTKPGEEESVNLFEYEYMIRERYYFYDSIVKELEFKRQLLITFNGMLNIESRI